MQQTTVQDKPIVIIFNYEKISSETVQKALLFHIDDLLYFIRFKVLFYDVLDIKDMA